MARFRHRVKPVNRTDDIFVKGGTGSENKLDLIYLGSFFLISVIMVFIFLIAPAVTSAGLIYSLLAFTAFMLILGALISKNKVFSVVIFGEDHSYKKILADLALGAGIVILISVIFPELQAALHFAILPFTVTPNSPSNDILITALVLIFVGPEIEEMFLNSTFIPSVGVFNKGSKSIIGAIIYHFALVILFFGAYIFGFTALIIGAALLLIGIITAPFLISNKKTRDSNPIIHIFAISLGVIFLSILHVYSYQIVNLQTAINALIPLGSFFTLEAFVNWYRQSAITSRSMHSLTNALAAAALGIVSMEIALLIYVIYMLFIFGLAYTHGSESKGTRLLSFYKTG